MSYATAERVEIRQLQKKKLTELNGSASFSATDTA